MIAAWIVVGSVVLMALLFAGVMIHAYRTWDGEPTCNLDCRDLHRYGLTAPDCPAYHGTDHFTTPREHAQFEADLDWQIQVGRK